MTGTFVVSPLKDGVINNAFLSTLVGSAGRSFASDMDWFNYDKDVKDNLSLVSGFYTLLCGEFYPRDRVYRYWGRRLRKTSDEILDSAHLVHFVAEWKPWGNGIREAHGHETPQLRRIYEIWDGYKAKACPASLLHASRAQQGAGAIDIEREREKAKEREWERAAFLRAYAKHGGGDSAESLVRKRVAEPRTLVHVTKQNENRGADPSSLRRGSDDPFEGGLARRTAWARRTGENIRRGRATSREEGGVRERAYHDHDHVVSLRGREQTHARSSPWVVAAKAEFERQVAGSEFETIFNNNSTF